MGRPSAYREEFVQLAYDTLSQGYSLAVLAGECGVSRETVDNWSKEHAEFLDAIKRGRAKGARIWEDRLAKLADAGVGNATGIIFGLKNRNPDDWRDKTEQELTGKDGGALETVTRIELVGVRPSGDRPD